MERSIGTPDRGLRSGLLEILGGRPDALMARDTARAMSQENVEVVGRMYDAFERGDYERSLSYLDPEIEFSQPAQEPGGGMYHGHDGVMQAFAKWLGPWDEYHVEVDELTDLGDHVLANTRHHGRGKGSGAPVEMQIFQLMTLRDGKIVRIRMYYDEAEALEAARLRE